MANKNITQYIGYLNEVMAACMIVKILTVNGQMGSQGVETEIAASKEKRQP